MEPAAPVAPPPASAAPEPAAVGPAAAAVLADPPSPATRRIRPSPSTEELPGSASGSRKKFPKHLVEIYDIEHILGQGAFSTVWRCRHRKTGEVRALKKIDTTELSPREIAHEIALMRLLRHESVVKCYDVFLEAQFVSIVIDMFTGGDLIDGLNAHRRSRGRIPDGQLSHITRQMVAAVVHVHSLRIVHRDIKGENFLSDRPDIGDPACRVALADFGTAMRIEPGEKLQSRVGTPAFWAPEVWAGCYDFLVDVWAVGVTTFILLTGALPFEGEAQICKPVVPGQAAVMLPHFASQMCQEFVQACLVKDPQKRPAATEAAQMPWMTAPLVPGSGGGGSGTTAPRVAPASHEATAAGVAGCVIDILAAIVVGCCSGLGLCLDILLGGDAGEQRQARLPGSALQQPTNEDIEKEVTELTRRISTNAKLPPPKGLRVA